MAQIIIAGNVKINSSGPDVGSLSTISFKLSDWMKRSDNALIVPSIEVFSLADTTGAITAAVLESTRDAVPATRYWRVMVRGTFGGKTVNDEIGKIQIRGTPSTQNPYDLLADALITEGSDRLMVETPTGTIDNVNKTFSTSTTPVPGTFLLFNSAAGGVLNPAAYTLDNGGNIVYVLAPQSGDYHVAVYRAA